MNQFDTRLLLRSVALYIIAAMLLLVLTTATSTSFIQKQRQTKKEQEYVAQIHKSMEHIVGKYIKNYISLVGRLVETSAIVKKVKLKDREGLYNLLKDKYRAMQEEEEYFQIMHIHLADGTSLLRMHQKEQFGDEIAKLRPMLSEIHTSHKILKGYETGKHGNVYRILHPIFDEEQNYIGAMEVGLNPNFIIRDVFEINGFSGLVFIKDDSLQLYPASSDVLIDGYSLQSKLTPELKKITAVLKRDAYLKDGTEIVIDDARYKIHLFVLYDFENSPKVKLLFFQDISEAGILRSYMLYIVLGSIGFILAVVSLLVYRRLEKYQKRVSNIYDKQIQKLDESENRFRLLYDKAPNAYQSLDVNGDILSVNSKWCEELGYTQEEVIGKDFSSFIVLENREKFRENFTAFKESGSVCGVEFEMICKDLTHITVEVDGNIIYTENGEYSHSQCTFTNITMQKELEAKLKFNDSYLQGIFDVDQNIMITTDCENIDRANPAMLSFFGFDSLEAFKNEHSCICDYFLEAEDNIWPIMNGVSWLKYILDSEEKYHKVCMKKDTKVYHFIVSAELLQVDEKQRSVVVFTDVTQMKELDERLEFAVNGTNDGIWDWNIDKQTVYFSPRWKSMLGYEDNELSNEFKTWENLIHPDDLEETYKKIEINHTLHDDIYENTHRLRHKDGHWVWILARGKSIFNEDGKAVRMVGFHTDISKSKNLEEELRASKELFNLFIENIPHAVVIKDENFNIVYANSHIGKYVDHDIVGTKAMKNVNKETAQEIYKLSREAQKNGVAEKIINIHIGNRSGYARILAFAIPKGSDEIWVGMLYIDITENYMDKEKLKKQEDIMIAQSRHAAMGEMISMIAHQWRQPISVIAMDANNILADIELETVDERTLQDGAEDIINQTQELSKTIDDFRNFFKPERIYEEVLVKDVINDALAVIGKSLENNNVEVTLEIEQEAKMVTYARELMQVVINIIKNSKEALLDKKPEDKKISLSVKSDEKSVSIAICDNAGGISSEVIGEIFNPYFTTKGSKNGTGLGLYMSKTIVEKHLDGRLNVCNQDDGVCFEIKLPTSLEKLEH